MLNMLLSKSMVPDSMIRVGIRRLLRMRLEEISEGGVQAGSERFEALVEELKASPIAIETDAANEQHYEIPAIFYEKCLGKYLKYSSGYWLEETESLSEAEAIMLEKTLQRADIKDGMRVLDLGCGWGSFSLYAAATMPNCEFVGLSNSNSQREFIMNRAKERGIENLTILTSDINEFETDLRFDRVVSVEMFEHMRNYQKLLAKVSSWMNDGGKLFVHIFTHREHAYKFEVRDETDWMSKYFFTGGIMPSDHLLLYFADDFKIEKHWRVSGEHYSKTSEAWLENMDAARSELMPVFEEVYGNEASLWWARWRIFYMACAELWGYENGNEWFVSHYRFEKRSHVGLDDADLSLI